MATEIVGTDEFRDWYAGLPVPAQEAVERIVAMLEDAGVQLGHPYCSSIKGSSIALRELRVQHMGEPYRILYVFDPIRQAVLLVGGTKLGREIVGMTRRSGWLSGSMRSISMKSVTGNSRWIVHSA